MAIYTAFMTNMGMTPPSTQDEGATWRTYLVCDITILDSSGVQVAPWGMGEPWAGFATITSGDYLVPSDTLTSLRNKMMNAVRPNYAPTITALDVIRVQWLDSGGLLNL